MTQIAVVIKKTFWKMLHNIDEHIDAPWLIIGDLNEVLNSNEGKKNWMGEL